VIATAVVFGGTMAPFFADLMGQGTLSVGAPYFNPMFLLPILPLLALVSIGTFARWKRGALGESRQRLLGTSAIAVVIGLALILGLYGDRSLLGPIGVVLGVWIILTALVDPVDRVRRGLSVSPSVLGMMVAHIGLGVITIGITTMETRMTERDVAMRPGDVAVLGDYSFRFDGVEEVDGPNYLATRGKVTVTRNDSPEEVLYPERRSYFVSEQALAEAALGVGWRRDLLATLGEPLGSDAWSLRLQVRPLMRYVWFGSALMALGGFLATLDRRYRRRREAEVAQSSAPARDLQPGVAP
jgi:cytochrome c-type biogenesis protein CcmF